MYLENYNLQEEILNRDQAREAHIYIRKLREIFRAKEQERGNTSEVFQKAARSRMLAQGLSDWLGREYGINYSDSSFEEEEKG